MLFRAILAAFAMTVSSAGAQSLAPEKPEGAIRVATFNAHLARDKAGALIADLRAGSSQIDNVVEIVQRVRPDILLLQEFDYDAEGKALSLMLAALREGRGVAQGVDYPHSFTALVNTGVPSGRDLSRSGKKTGPGNAFGFGLFPGQYGMALLSMHPIDSDAARTFRTLLWKDMPGARFPKLKGGAPYYPPGALEIFRLSSKSHWDAPVRLPDGRALHMLASHPTPPVFDGPENRNGLRNHDEVRFWIDYIDGANWMTDDAGRTGGLPDDASFVVLGDLNVDPEDGDGESAVIRRLLTHTRAQDAAPSSKGGAVAGRSGAANAGHKGDPGLDTADWSDGAGKSGNLRVDHVIPSSDMQVVASGVVWPEPGHPLRRLVGGGRKEASSDHRLVWVDLVVD